MNTPPQDEAPAYPDLTPENYRDMLGQFHGVATRLAQTESSLAQAQATIAEANARASHSEQITAELTARAAQLDGQRLQAEAMVTQAQAQAQAATAQAQAQAATAHAQAHAQAAGHNSGSSGARPKRPEDFKGKDSIVPITLWIIVVEQFLRVSGIPVSLWAEHVAMMFAGPALTWWAKRKIDGIADQDTWDTLKSALLMDFMRPNAVRNLRDRLAACRQNNGSALSYANEFRSILVEFPAGEVSPEEAFDRFYRGLKPDLRVELNKARIKDLNEAISYADSIESSYSQGQRNDYRSQYIRFNSGRSSSGSRGNAGSSAAPMELGAVSTPARSTSANGVPRLSAMQRAQHDVQRRCYRCHRTGHNWRNCPRSTTSAAPGNGSAR